MPKRRYDFNRMGEILGYHMAGGSGEMRKYKARIADKILEKRLLGKGAVLIEGPKWCGKTTTAEQIAMCYRATGDECWQPEFD